MKYLILAEGHDQSSLAYSYYRTLKKQVLTTDIFIISDEIIKCYPFGFLPKSINNSLFGLLEFKSTIQKFNVILTKYILKAEIDVVFCFTNSPINSSTIVYLRSLDKKVILIYPDAIINMQTRNSSTIPSFDAIFSYSKKGMIAFNYLGAKNVFWCPLAGDEDMHNMVPRIDSEFEYDLSFIGNYRPEREEVLLFIINNFPTLKIKINGSWKNAKSEEVKKVAENKQIYGMEYAKYLNKSFINLNIIDHSNYPAANMRFFEIPTAGGFQISSSCPEMEEDFIEGEHLMYYSTLEELSNKINFCFKEKEKVAQIRENGHQLVLAKHLYKHRLESILKTM